MNWHDERALLRREATELSSLQLTGTEWLSQKELSRKLGERIKDEMVSFLYNRTN